MESGNRLMTAKELAEFLNKGLAQTYKLIREGEFDDFLVKIGAKPTYRFRPAGLNEYLERGGRVEKEAQA